MITNLQLIVIFHFLRFGEVSHYILNEQIAEYGKTFTVPKTSIYKPKMDQTLLRVVQAGLGKFPIMSMKVLICDYQAFVFS